IALQGPPTPQHAVFTKRLPLLGRDVPRYAHDYRAYLTRFGPPSTPARLLPDPAPRIVLDPEFGLVAASVDARNARITADIYRHDIRIISRASAHDRYVSLDPDAVLLAEIHYGGFDRQLRARAAQDLPLLGRIALVLSDSQAQVDELLARGAAVVRVGPVAEPHEGVFCLPQSMLSDPAALTEAVFAFGGIDFVVSREPAWRGLPFLHEVMTLAPPGPA
ncbi:MAG: hypothetical protein ABI794_18200, partial [Betaproteobacteria bacterium]